MPAAEIDHARAREDLCRLLAASWYAPDPDFAQERLADSLRAAAGRLGQPLAEPARRLAQAFEAQDLQALARDYEHLLVGAARVASPHESGWRAGDADDGEEAAMALHGLYQAGGFEPETDETVGADHVAAQLEFLWLVSGKYNEARRTDLSEVASSWQLLRTVFLRQHLGAWVGRFAGAVQAGASTPFYRELAQLTALFVATETAAAAPD